MTIIKSYTIEQAIQEGFVDAEDNAEIAASVCVLMNSSENKIKIGAQAVLGENCVLHSGVKIGDRSKLGCFVVLEKNIEIGDDVSIGNFVHIGNDAKIQSGVELKNSVHIGACTVIKINSVVTRNMPDNIIACGAPAYAVDENE